MQIHAASLTTPPPLPLIPVLQFRLSPPFSQFSARTMGRTKKHKPPAGGGCTAQLATQTDLTMDTSNCIHASCATRPADNQRVWLRGITKAVAERLGHPPKWYKRRRLTGSARSLRGVVCLCHFTDSAKKRINKGDSVVLLPRNLRPPCNDPVVTGASGRQSPAAALAARPPTPATPPPSMLWTGADGCSLANIARDVEGFDKALAARLKSAVDHLFDEQTALEQRLEAARQDAISAKRGMAALVSHSCDAAQEVEHAQCTCGCMGTSCFTWDHITLSEEHASLYTTLSLAQLEKFLAFLRITEAPSVYNDVFRAQAHHRYAHQPQFSIPSS